jgi:uncharacterized damage-inducible protein DinB
MESSKWFDREFDLGFGPEKYAAIYHRLKSAPQRLRQSANGLSESTLIDRPGGKWSIKEQAAHLSVMEPLWRVRFLDIRTRKPTLTVADLTNSATTDGGFNAVSMDELLRQFDTQRTETLQLLDSIDVLDTTCTSLHPRLKQPMRIIDLAYFVAEHDDHHITIIKEMR